MVLLCQPSQGEITEPNPTKFYDMLGSESSLQTHFKYSAGGPSRKNEELELFILHGTVFNSTKLCEMPKK